MAKSATQKQDQENQADAVEKIDEIQSQENNENQPGQEELEVEAPQEEELPQQEEAAALLQKQIDDLRKSEEIEKGRAERYRQEAEEAQALALQRQQEAYNGRKDANQAQYDAISVALRSAQERAEAAESEIESAVNNGDIKAQIAATRKLVNAENSIGSLQAGQAELEARIKNPPASEDPKQNQMPPQVQRWLQKNADFLGAKNRMDKVRGFHWDILEEGHDFGSSEYIESMERKLGLRRASDEEETVQKKPKSESSSLQVSAPVSREAPTGSGGSGRSGQIRLTPQQREAAANAGVTEKVYAENLQRLIEMKKNGMYTGGQ